MFRYSNSVNYSKIFMLCESIQLFIIFHFQAIQKQSSSWVMLKLVVDEFFYYNTKAPTCFNYSSSDLLSFRIVFHHFECEKPFHPIILLYILIYRNGGCHNSCDFVNVEKLFFYC